MELLVYAVIAVGGGVIASTIAKGKGRDAAGWFILGFFLPLIGILLAAVMPPPRKDQVKLDAVASGEMKRCPSCAELVRREAVKCQAFDVLWLNGRAEPRSVLRGVRRRAIHRSLQSGLGGDRGEAAGGYLHGQNEVA